MTRPIGMSSAKGCGSGVDLWPFPDPRGFSVIDTWTGEPATFANTQPTGISKADADDLCDLLNRPAADAGAIDREAIPHRTRISSGAIGLSRKFLAAFRRCFSAKPKGTFTTCIFPRTDGSIAVARGGDGVEPGGKLKLSNAADG
jgi:hypothetical protein